MYAINSLKKYFRNFLIISFLFSVNIFPQISDSLKSVNKNTGLLSGADSLYSADSLSVTDSLSAAENDSTKKKSDIDAVVYTSSTDSLNFNIPQKEMNAWGQGELKYKKTSLSGGKIKLNFITNEVESEGVPDTSVHDREKFKDTPVLSEDGEVYEGFKLRYNFKSQRGFISMAKNKQDGSRYEGTKVKKVSKDTYFIQDGIFTTCDADTPHTYFTASEMKVVNKEQIIAKWIFMYIGGVPVPIPLPFAVFPNNTGRRSGILPPGYSVTNDRGQAFTNFGYFWAASDYFDYTVNADYYSRGSFGLRNRIRYVKRYEYSGNIQLGFSDLKTGTEGQGDFAKQQDWNISVTHNQKFNPTTQLDVNLRFVTSNYINNNSYNYNDLLSRTISSSASFRKYWDGASLTMSYTRDQRLDDNVIYETLPNVSFSKSQAYPFKSSKSTGTNQKWYELIGYTYSGQFLNKRNKTDGDLHIRGGVQHSVRLNASPKIGYFSITPSFNYSEKWYNKRIEKYWETTTVYDTAGNARDSVWLATRDIKELNFVRTFDFSLSATTKMYGMMSPGILGIEAFRHTITPTVSYTYRPDFGEDKWGYYDSYIDTLGRVQEYDKFGDEVFGGSGNGERQSISFRLGNIFEIKTAKDPTDTSSQEKKIRLLNLDAGLSYNFAADSMKLSALNVSYRTQIGEWLNLSGSSNFTFYDYDVNTNRLINKYLYNVGKGLVRMTSFSMSVSSTLSGEKLAGSDKPQQSKQEDRIDNGFSGQAEYLGIYDEEPADFSIPWDMGMSYNYRLDKSSPLKSTVSSNLSMNLSLNFSKNWKFKVQASYDLDKKVISAPRITVYRDLHCWEMNFAWNPLGRYSGFRFEIRLKAPQLKDIKVTKSDGQFVGTGF